MGKYNIINQRLNLEGSRPWNMSVNIYTQAGNIIRQEGLFAFMFTNVGDTKAFVNGMVVFPNATPTKALGDSRSASGHLLDLYQGNITLSFDLTGGGVAPAVEIVQFFYSEETVTKRSL